MTSAFRAAVLAVALLGGAGLATAQTGAVIGPGTSLELTPQQKTAIYQIVTREKLRTPPPANTQAIVGAQVPAATELYALPDTIAAEVPSAKMYKYTIVQNEVVIVDPTNMRVIDVIRQ